MLPNMRNALLTTNDPTVRRLDIIALHWVARAHVARSNSYDQVDIVLAATPDLADWRFPACRTLLVLHAKHARQFAALASH